MKGCMNFEEEGTEEVVGGREREGGGGRMDKRWWKVGDREGARNIRELIQLWECGREFN